MLYKHKCLIVYMAGKDQSEPLSTSEPQYDGITSLTFAKIIKKLVSVGLEVS